MALGKRVRVLALRQQQHLDIHAVLKQQLDTPQRSLDARGVSVIDKRDIARETLDKPHLLNRQSRARRSHHIAYARLVHRYDIHVTLHDDTLPGLGDSLLGLKHTVELATLRIDIALGRVDILGHRLVRAQSAASKSHHLARKRMHWINHTSAETVIDAPVIGAGAQTGSQDILLAVTALYGRLIEPVATLERVAQMETLYHLVTDAAVAEVAQTHIAPLVGIGEIGLEMAQRKLVDRKHIVAGSLSALLLGRHLALLDFDIILARQITQRLRIAQVLELHEKIDRTATLSATETLAETA